MRLTTLSSRATLRSTEVGHEGFRGELRGDSEIWSPIL